MKEKHVGESNLKSLVAWIRKQLSKKLESVTNNDRTVNVTEGRKVSVRISKEEGNGVQVRDGLYVPDKPVATDAEIEEMIEDVFGNPAEP